MATLSAALDALKWPMKEKGLERQWNMLKAIASATIGGNVTISGSRTTLGALDLDTAADLALSVNDAAGVAITPKFTYPNPGKDRATGYKTPSQQPFRF